MPDYKAKSSVYSTIQGDMWDLIALTEYGDEHAMNVVQDNNFDLRFTDMFMGDIKVAIAATASVQENLKAGKAIPNIQALMPWRT